MRECGRGREVTKEKHIVKLLYLDEVVDTRTYMIKLHRTKYMHTHSKYM